MWKLCEQKHVWAPGGGAGGGAPVQGWVWKQGRAFLHVGVGVCSPLAPLYRQRMESWWQEKTSGHR